MTAIEDLKDLNDVDPDATLPGFRVHHTSRRRPAAWLSALLLVLIAAVAIAWSGFDIERAAARSSVVPALTIDARHVLDDAQREQPWPDPLVNAQNPAPAAHATVSRRADN